MMPDSLAGFALVIVAVALGVPLLVFLFSTSLAKAAEWSDRSEKRRRAAGLIVFGVYVCLSVLQWLEHGPGLRAYFMIVAALFTFIIALRPAKNPELAGLTRSEREALERHTAELSGNTLKEKLSKNQT